MRCYKDIDECWLERPQEEIQRLFLFYSELIYKYLQLKENAVQYIFMKV